MVFTQYHSFRFICFSQHGRRPYECGRSARPHMVCYWVQAWPGLRPSATAAATVLEDKPPAMAAGLATGLAVFRWKTYQFYKNFTVFQMQCRKS